MAFHEVNLPEEIEQGSSGGPRFKTYVVVLASGHERRNIEWEKTRAVWNIAYDISEKSFYKTIIEFFYARQGRAHGFRFKDWTDFELARQSIGTTDTSTATYQAFKRYSSGGIDFDRTLNKLSSGTVQVWVNNVSITEGAGTGEFTVNLNTGVITIGSALAAQSGTDVELLSEFDVPVRFSSDELEMTAYQEAVAHVDPIMIEELRI